MRVLTNSRAPVVARLKFWKKCLFPACDHYLAGIKPTINAAERFDSHINKLARFIVKVQLQAGDDRETFCRRRNSQIARFRKLAEFDFRCRWGLKLATWVEHLHRHRESPAFALLTTQDDAWLRQRRMEVGMFGKSRGLYSGETRTKALGTVQRWGTSWLERVRDLHEHGWDNPTRIKAHSQSRAHTIVSNFLTRSSAALALGDG